MRWFRSNRVGKSPHKSPPRRHIRLFVEQCESRRMLAASASVSMTMYHNDNSSSGQNLFETQLTPSNVNSATFGKLFSTAVDGQVYAQPLYLSSQNITAGSSPGIHNVVYVATEHDSLYAIDSNSGAVLWRDSFINPAAGITTVPGGDTATSDISPEIGITATPVIDSASGTLYLIAKTKQTIGRQLHYVQTLYAIDVAGGGQKGSTVIADTIATNPGNPGSSSYGYVGGPAVNGSGAGSVNGVVHFNALRQMERPGLTLANGSIYLAFASHGDNGPYHGWVLSYNAQTLQLNGVFNTTPNGTQGGIWQSGDVVAVDAQGALYVETGNGTFDTTMNGSGMPVHGDYGDSFIKIVVDSSTSATNQNVNGWGLKAVDYFTPFNQGTLSQHDSDLGSGGPMLLPDSAGSAAHPHLMIGGGKEGRIYLIDRDNMGRFSSTSDHVVQEQTGAGGIFDTPAFFNNGTTSYFYFGTIGNALKAFTVANASFSTAPVAHSSDTFAFPGTTPSVSANGTSSGIVWGLDHGTNQLRAYDANNVASELYTSAQAANGRDALGSTTKFSVPTVVDGKVFVGTSNSLAIFGPVTPPPPPQLGPGPYSLWSTTTVPGWIDNPDSQAVELGVKFRSDNDGFISGIRFYKSAKNTGTHIADFWSTDGTLLASATFAAETSSGWQTVNFSQPVAIKANTTYIASYHTDTGNYSDALNYFSSGLNSGPLHALADGLNGPNGVFHYGAAGSFPTDTYHASNYWVDVLLTSLVNSVTPGNGATGVAIGVSVAVRFNASMNAATLNSNTLVLQDSSSNAVATNISYDSSSMTATLTPQSPLANGKTYSVIVKGGASGVSDQNGDTLASNFSSSFTTAVIVTQTTPIGIWSNSTVPGWTDNPDTQAVELGMKFRSDVDGFITGLRFYKSAKNTGTHVANLWGNDGTLLATATFTGETASGWQTVNFSQPVAIKANTTYIASYHTNAGHYSHDIGFFSNSGVTTGPLHALQDGVDGSNSVFHYGAGGVFPTDTYRSSNYWVDVLFTT